MTLKAASNKVDEHTSKMEAVHIEFEEGGYHVQGREWRKKHRGKTRTTRLPRVPWLVAKPETTSPNEELDDASGMTLN